MNVARPKRRVAFMGLTPLIDMIFLLLLFFLLGSDFVTYGQSRLAPPRGTGGETSAAPPVLITFCLLYTSPSPRDKRQSRMPSSA